MSCLIAGDSIAVGTALYFHECRVNAKVGIPSGSIIGRVSSNHNQWVVISSGSNDPYNSHLRSNLEATRARINADNVIWILPQNGHAASVVRSVALEHGDHVIAFKAGRDHVHPASYSAVAHSIKSVL